ncbi:hypothetical protein POWCR01_000223400 [Plasmodium ovale]|uniref:PIR protein n=1 Tax=Plasmodium ovale TaxID=36330 RepID=A0A1C3KKK9_PLAOA|nr:hypothetical protein POWCR01_000223400 [Plasmodium ovale]
MKVSKIYHMEKDIYEKTEKLFSVYFLYKIFISNTLLTSPCSHANSCSRAHNDIITTYTQIDDTKFCKALRDFKNEFDDNVKISTAECHSEIENLLLYPDECNRRLDKLEQGIASMQQQNGQLERQLESGGRSDPKYGDPTVDIPKKNNISLSSFVYSSSTVAKTSDTEIWRN